MELDEDGDGGGYVRGYGRGYGRGRNGKEGMGGREWMERRHGWREGMGERRGCRGKKKTN
jgi:hypothetical protein